MLTSRDVENLVRKKRDGTLRQLAKAGNGTEGERGGCAGERSAASEAAVREDEWRYETRINGRFEVVTGDGSVLPCVDGSQIAEKRRSKALSTASSRLAARRRQSSSAKRTAKQQAWNRFADAVHQCRQRQKKRRGTWTASSGHQPQMVRLATRAEVNSVACIANARKCGCAVCKNQRARGFGRREAIQQRAQLLFYGALFAVLAAAKIKRAVAVFRLCPLRRRLLPNHAGKSRPRQPAADGIPCSSTPSTTHMPSAPSFRPKQPAPDGIPCSSTANMPPAPQSRPKQSTADCIQRPSTTSMLPAPQCRLQQSAAGCLQRPSTTSTPPAPECRPKQPTADCIQRPSTTSTPPALQCRPKQSTAEGIQRPSTTSTPAAPTVQTKQSAADCTACPSTARAPPAPAPAAKGRGPCGWNTAVKKASRELRHRVADSSLKVLAVASQPHRRPDNPYRAFARPLAAGCIAGGPPAPRAFAPLLAPGGRPGDRSSGAGQGGYGGGTSLGGELAIRAGVAVSVGCRSQPEEHAVHAPQLLQSSGGSDCFPTPGFAETSLLLPLGTEGLLPAPGLDDGRLVSCDSEGLVQRSSSGGNAVSSRSAQPAGLGVDQSSLSLAQWGIPRTTDTLAVHEAPEPQVSPLVRSIAAAWATVSASRSTLAANLKNRLRWLLADVRANPAGLPPSVADLDVAGRRTFGAVHFIEPPPSNAIPRPPPPCRQPEEIDDGETDRHASQSWHLITPGAGWEAQVADGVGWGPGLLWSGIGDPAELLWRPAFESQREGGDSGSAMRLGRPNNHSMPPPPNGRYLVLDGISVLESEQCSSYQRPRTASTEPVSQLELPTGSSSHRDGPENGWRCTPHISAATLPPGGGHNLPPDVLPPSDTMGTPYVSTTKLRAKATAPLGDALRSGCQYSPNISAATLLPGAKHNLSAGGLASSGVLIFSSNYRTKLTVAQGDAPRSDWRCSPNISSATLLSGAKPDLSPDDHASSGFMGTPYASSSKLRAKVTAPQGDAPLPDSLRAPHASNAALSLSSQGDDSLSDSRGAGLKAATTSHRSSASRKAARPAPLQPEAFPSCSSLRQQPGGLHETLPSSVSLLRELREGSGDGEPCPPSGSAESWQRPVMEYTIHDVAASLAGRSGGTCHGLNMRESRSARVARPPSVNPAPASRQKDRSPHRRAAPPHGAGVMAPPASSPPRGRRDHAAAPLLLPVVLPLSPQPPARAPRQAAAGHEGAARGRPAARRLRPASPAPEDSRTEPRTSPLLDWPGVIYPATLARPATSESDSSSWRETQSRSPGSPPLVHTEHGPQPPLAHTQHGPQPPLAHTQHGPQPPLAHTQHGPQPPLAHTQHGPQPLLARTEHGPQPLAHTEPGPQPLPAGTGSGGKYPMPPPGGPAPAGRPLAPSPPSADVASGGPRPQLDLDDAPASQAIDFGSVSVNVQAVSVSPCSSFSLGTSTKAPLPLCKMDDAPPPSAFLP
ncbi:hypothetical protein DIPPA_23749 [Diplonema papillatum]|nr:hypothetical protein DIPPA_23749 [Diplonema papillatum]